MARLETQINQIFLLSPESKKNALVLYEEQLNNSLQLYVVAELWNMQKKSEANDLKKISEIILQCFRVNKKLPAETLFETSLSQINQNLADLAHEGRKSWVGKFSCLICVKGLDNNIYLANNGQTSAWLRRKSEMMEVLPAEKRGNHPLKSFINFTQGKLTDQDSLILTTSNIFNYISFELFSKMLDQMPLDQASNEVSKILQDAKAEEMAFASFMMYFTKEPIADEAPLETEQLYAPLPEEELVAAPVGSRISMPSLKLPSLKFSMPKISLPTLNIGWFKNLRSPAYFQNLSRPGKFFFISFAVFLLLFLVNLGIYAGTLNEKKVQKQITELVEKINKDVASANSALIYKDETQAIEYLRQGIADLESLALLDPVKAEEMSVKIEQVKTVVNKITSKDNPAVFLELKRHPTFITNSAVGFLFGNADSNSLSRYDSTLQDYFLLNSLKNPLTDINYSQISGVIVSSGNQIFRIDPTLKQFEPLITIENADLETMHLANNAIYTLDQGNDQILKIGLSSKYPKTVSVSGNVTTARDFGVDKDIYVLFADKIVKYVGGLPQTFALPNMTDSLSNGDKIQVGADIYVLEANKKRVIILSKTGALINQIYFPTTNTLTDFYIDEASRSLYLLDDNKLYKVTI